MTHSKSYFVNPLFLFIIFMTFSFGNNYRILGVFPIPIRSHFFLGSSLMKALVGAGHDVTIISPFKEKDPPCLKESGSYREIILEEVEANFLKRTMRNEKLDKRPMGKLKGVINFLMTMTPIFEPIGEDTLRDQGVSNLTHSNEQFDVVIVTEFFSDVLMLLAHHFNASLILFSNNALLSWYYDSIGNIALPSISPVYLVEMPFRMSLPQRLENLLEKLRMFMWLQTYNLQQDEIARKYFRDAPSVEKMRKSVSVVLINAHFSTEMARQTTPSMINIGGFHINTLKKIPLHLQEVMDNASNGIIYFSFGTVLNPEMIPLEKLQEILQVLGKRKETILWKFSGKLKDKPKNVHFGEWFPQQEILAHPKTKLFITHSGYSSTTETTYYGVPTISVPFFGDQPSNARYLVETGSGVLVPVESFGADTLGAAIEKVLSNRTYNEAAQRKSKIMRDRQNKPVDDAIFWIEYVVRHKGAKHLRVHYIDMPLYEVYMLDILGIIFVGLIVVGILFTCLLMIITKCVKSFRNKQITCENSSKKIN